MRVGGVVMREVDQSALIVPNVFAMNDDVVTRRDRDALADVDVVVDEQSLRRTLHLHDETLMRARWAGVIRQQLRDCALRGDLNGGAMIREGTLDGRVFRDDRAASRGEGGAKDEGAKAAQCSKALRKRPAAIRSASAITTTIAMRRKSLVT